MFCSSNITKLINGVVLKVKENLCEGARVSNSMGSNVNITATDIRNTVYMFTDIVPILTANCMEPFVYMQARWV